MQYLDPADESKRAGEEIQAGGSDDKGNRGTDYSCDGSKP